jgi:hypothetical protein
MFRVSDKKYIIQKPDLIMSTSLLTDILTFRTFSISFSISNLQVWLEQNKIDNNAGKQLS